MVDNVEWLFSMQGTFAKQGMGVAHALEIIAAQVRTVAAEVTEAPYKPTMQIFREVFRRRAPVHSVEVDKQQGVVLASATPSPAPAESIVVPRCASSAIGRSKVSPA